mgnify:CR=1 FL=1
MVKHIVLWNLTDPAHKDENAAQMKEKLEGLCGQVDGLLSAQVTCNITPGGIDVCLVSMHTDKAALDLYQGHPAHLAVKEFVHKVIESRYCHDAEV